MWASGHGIFFGFGCGYLWKEYALRQFFILCILLGTVMFATGLGNCQSVLKLLIVVQGLLKKLLCLHHNIKLHKNATFSIRYHHHQQHALVSASNRKKKKEAT